MVLTCLKCGRHISEEDAVYCPFCSSRLKTEASKRSDFLTAGGILMIVAASICVIAGLAALAVFLSTYQNVYYYGWGERSYYMPRYEDLLAGTVGILAFACGLAGGILALKRRNFTHCLVGGSLAVFEGFLVVFAFAAQYPNSWIVGVIFGVPIIILSVPAVLFVSISKEEFSLK